MTDIETIDQERGERGIAKSDLSILVGYQNKDGWYQAVRNNWNPEDKLQKAQWVFEYFDTFGYIPDPREVPR